MDDVYPEENPLLQKTEELSDELIAVRLRALNQVIDQKAVAIEMETLRRRVEQLECLIASGQHSVAIE